MTFILIFALLPVLQTGLAASIHEYKTYNDYKFYEVKGYYENIRNLINILEEKTELPYYNIRESEAHFLIAPELAQIFEEAALLEKLDVRLLIDDYSELIEEEKSGLRSKEGFGWTAYYDVDDIYAFLHNVSETYSESTEVIVGGESYQGRKLLGLRINTPDEKTDKPVVFIESGIHAREWITPATTTYFINQLLTSKDTSIIRLRKKFDWRIFPTVNPDGYHHSFKFDRMWRKTRSKSKTSYCYGADANRNWDYNWLQHGATNDPCDYQTYGGTKPFSEKETSTLSKYISNIENLRAYIAFHSDAQMLLTPYSDSVDHVDNYDDLIQIGKTSLEYGQRVNGEEYSGPGTAAELLYKASGGSMDWVRSALGTPIVYTYELRGTYFHWPPSRIHEQGDEVTQMLLGLFDEADKLGYF